MPGEILSGLQMIGLAWTPTGLVEGRRGDPRRQGRSQGSAQISELDVQLSRCSDLDAVMRLTALAWCAA